MSNKTEDVEILIKILDEIITIRRKMTVKQASDFLAEFNLGPWGANVYSSGPILIRKAKIPEESFNLL